MFFLHGISNGDSRYDLTGYQTDDPRFGGMKPAQICAHMKHPESWPTRSPPVVSAPCGLSCCYLSSDPTPTVPTIPSAAGAAAVQLEEKGIA